MFPICIDSGPVVNLFSSARSVSKSFVEHEMSAVVFVNGSKLGSKGKLQFPSMWSAWLRNEAHFRTGLPCKAHGWAHSWQHHFQDEIIFDSPSASRERSISRIDVHAIDSLAVGKSVAKTVFFSVSRQLRPHQRPWHSGIEISYCSSLHTNGHRRSRLAGARSQSYSLATQQGNINLHAAWYWFRSIHGVRNAFSLSEPEPNFFHKEFTSESGWSGKFLWGSVYR